MQDYTYDSLKIKTNCPFCENNDYISINTKYLKEIPHPGCVYVCYNCLNLSIFDKYIELLKIYYDKRALEISKVLKGK